VCVRQRERELAVELVCFLSGIARSQMVLEHRPELVLRLPGKVSDSYSNVTLHMVVSWRPVYNKI
jgi:hypothetical protein